MKLTHEDMKNYFGIVYAPDGYFKLDAKELPIYEKFDLDRNYFSTYYSTQQEAIAQVKQDIVQKEAEELKTMDSYLQTFKELSFSRKMSWRFSKNRWSFEKVTQERKAKVKDDAKNLSENIHIIELDKNKAYNLDAPHFLKNNQELYLVVINTNGLEMGIYSAKTRNVEYTLMSSGNSNNNVVIKGDLVVSLPKEDEQSFSFSSEKEQFRSHHTYHHIFSNKEQALAFYKEEVQNKIDIMQKRLIEFEANITNTPNNKPKNRM